MWKGERIWLMSGESHKRVNILTATYMLEPGLYLTEQILAFMSMFITLDSWFVHHTLTFLKPKEERELSSYSTSLHFYKRSNSNKS